MDFLKNLFNTGKYKTNSEAVIISCYFNPQNSPYRLKAFNIFYDSIKHLNHRIIECVIGDAKPQLPENENIKRVYTQNLLWHKEALLNLIVADLPKKFNYVFWIDADVIFTNNNWLVEACKELELHSIVQPFEYCIHLERDEVKPSFDLMPHKLSCMSPKYTNRRVWRSFCANFHDENLETDVQKDNYNIHGHVGFAWGARREVLDKVPLYDKALIGGADHIIAHAAAGQIPHSCITKSFTDDLDNVMAWSRRFYAVVGESISYVEGDLYHIWHGDIDKRQYLKRIQDFTPKTKHLRKDPTGLYVTHAGDDEYMKNYFRTREVTDDGFLTSMAIGYMTDNADLGMMMGGNPVGAMVGDMLNNTDDQIQVDTQQDFGGGQMGGAGSTVTWTDEPNTQQDQPQDIQQDMSGSVAEDVYTPDVPNSEVSSGDFS